MNTRDYDKHPLLKRHDPVRLRRDEWVWLNDNGSKLKIPEGTIGRVAYDENPKMHVRVTFEWAGTQLQHDTNRLALMRMKEKKL